MVRLLTLLPLIVLGGCSKDSYEKVTVDYLTVMGNFVKACESIETEEQAETQKTELVKLLNDLKSLKVRTAELGEADEETREGIEKRYEDQFQTLSDDFSKTISKIEQNPKVAKELETEMKALAKLVNARPIRWRR